MRIKKTIHFIKYIILNVLCLMLYIHVTILSIGSNSKYLICSNIVLSVLFLISTKSYKYLNYCPFDIIARYNFRLNIFTLFKKSYKSNYKLAVLIYGTTTLAFLNVLISIYILNG